MFIEAIMKAARRALGAVKQSGDNSVIGNLMASAAALSRTPEAALCFFLSTLRVAFTGRPNPLRARGGLVARELGSVGGLVHDHSA